MGTNYLSDRQFTDFVHTNIAIKQIYEPIGWIPQKLNEKLSVNVDMNNGVDYFLVDGNQKKIVTVQERFREVKYRNYNDFTIRFEREYNPHEERKLSEYYKLNSDFFVYGIIDSYKVNVNTQSRFIKFAIIDLKVLKELMDQGKIVINRGLDSYVCKMINGVLNCPVNYNKDKSSSFFPVDIKILIDHYGSSNIVIKNFGF